MKNTSLIWLWLGKPPPQEHKYTNFIPLFQIKSIPPPKHKLCTLSFTSKVLDPLQNTSLAIFITRKPVPLPKHKLPCIPILALITPGHKKALEIIHADLMPNLALNVSWLAS